MSEFDEYIVHGEPGQKEKADAWHTAIGLQDVDGLKVSAYLLDTAFLIKYLRSMGIPATNDMFKAHSWYFRNALVRASYKGFDISPTMEFVERFLRNVILGEKNKLRNRDMLFGASLPKYTPQSITMSDSKSQFDTLNYSLEELAVIRVIENDPKITQTQIAKSIKKSASTVKRITSALVAKGILIRRNGRRNGWWEILTEQ